ADHRLIPVVVEPLAARAVDPLEGVSPEVVALGLDETGGETLRAHPVVIGEGRRVGGRRYPGADRAGDDSPPRLLCRAERIGEEGGEHEVLETGVVPVGGGDVLEEGRPDDASCTPEGRHRTRVDVPAV